MGTSHLIMLVLVGWISVARLVIAADLLFPHMYGLNYSEHDQALKLGLTAHVCKDEAEWYAMTTADFAKYKAIIIPDCQCNTSLDTIKFLDDTKSTWSPAVTGNMVIIGTDPSFHHKWFKLAGADAMMNDSIRLVSTGENGTGMYMSLSCYYQSVATPVPITALSEIGDFQVRGNLSHPCLNTAHLVATSDVMTSLNDELASNWNCSVHEAFSEYPTKTTRGFQALAIALNATGPGQRSFGDGTSGIPYIIARGATPVGCGNSMTEPGNHEECDDGPANGTPGALCSSSCKCIFGMVTPGVCHSNTTSSSTSSTPSSTLDTSSSSSHGDTTVTVTGWPSNHSNSTTSRIPNTGPATVTVFPPPPPRQTSSRWTSDTTRGPLPGRSSNDTVWPIPPPKTVTVEPPMHSGPVSGPRTVTVLPPSASDSIPGSVPGTVTVLPTSASDSVPASIPGTVTVQPPSSTVSPPRTVTVLPPAPSDSTPVPPTVTVQPPKPSVFMPVSMPVSVPKSSTSPVTASGEPDTQSPKPSTSTAASGSGSWSSTSPGNVTVTASGEPDTQSLKPSTYTAASGSGSGSWSTTNTGNMTVTGSVDKGTPTPKPSVSETVPVSNPFTSPGSGILTVTASGLPGQSGTRPPKESISTREKSSSTRSSNSTDTLPGRSDTVTTVPVPTFPGNTVSRQTVTATPSDESSQRPNSPTNSASHESSSSTSQEPIKSSRRTPSIVTVTAHPSSPSESALSSVNTDYSSESATISGSQPPQPVVTVTALPNQSRTSSAEKETTTASGSVSVSAPRHSSWTAISSSSPTGQTGTSKLTRGTQQSSQTLSTTSALSRTHGNTTTVQPPGSSSTVPPGTRGTRSGSSSFSSTSSPSLSGTVSAEPSNGESSQLSSSIHISNTPSHGTGSKSWTSSSGTGSALSTNLPIETSTEIASDSDSRLPTTKPSPDGTSRVKTTSSSGLPKTSTARDRSDSHSGISTVQSTAINDPFKTSSSENSRTNSPSGISSSPSFSIPPFNSSTFSTSSTTATSSAAQNGNPSPSSSTVGASPNHCDTWVGIEIIHMIEITEICPEGSTVTETVTEIVETMTRSICQTSATNLPCYPCIFGTPTSSQDTATVTVTSCSTLIEPTVTVTVQLCKACTTTTYIGTVPGYTPGAPCHACSPYNPASATASIPPLVAISPTPLGYNPVPPAITSNGNNRPLPTSVPLSPDNSSSSGPSGTKSPISFLGGIPGGGPESGVSSSTNQPLPPAKGTLLSSKTPDPNIPYGFPTTPATPYPPSIVTAGTVRNVARCIKGMEVLLGVYFMYAMMFAWL